LTPSALLLGTGTKLGVGRRSSKRLRSLVAPSVPPRSLAGVYMSLSAILIALAILFIIATVPVWPYSRTWGVWPSGALGLVLVVLVGVLVMG
jgi:hypothetical protein